MARPGTISAMREAALANGRTRFSTGEPCASGHLAERFSCSMTCVECARIYEAKKYIEKKERYLQRGKEYRKRHSEKIKERERSRRIKRKASHKKYIRRWEEKNKEILSVKRAAYYRKNRDRILQRTKNYAKSHPGRSIVAGQRRRARNRNAEGSFRIADVRNIIKLQKNKCAYCRVSFDKEKYHIDHIMPLARGGSNYPKNIQILCGPCNLRKSDKDPMEFSRQLGMML